MFKRLAFTALTALAFTTAHAGIDADFAKQSIDATQPLQIDLQPDGTLTPSDLTLDLGFYGSGMRSLWAETVTGWSDTEDGLRVFPWVTTLTPPGGAPTPTHGGYYVIAKQKNSAGDQWRGWIARVKLDGTIDSSFGTGGWIFTNAQDDIVDAAVVGSKAYILSNIFSGTIARPATRVNCIDLTTATGSACFAGVGGVQTWGASAAGPRTAAYGQRLLYDSRYGLFVAARVMNNNRGQEVGIAKISATDGSLDASFRDAGYSIGLPSWAPASGAEIRVNDLAIVPAGYPGGARLYVAGQMKISATDHDGFILGVSPTSGFTSTGWGWNNFYYEEDNTDYKKDAVTAITVLRNGKVAFAGWSETDDAEVTPMILGRVNVDGSYDHSFCGGDPNDSVYACRMDPSGPYDAPVSLPVAIAERRQNRDLVVAERFQNNDDHNGDYHPYQAVRQFSANGTVRHARQVLDFSPYSGLTPWSRPFGMWIGGTGPWDVTSNTGLGEEVVAVVGTHLWFDADYDATISQLVATDSIFADAFGGKNGD